MPRDPRHWSAYEAEVSHYFQHEEGVSAQCLDGTLGTMTDPKPPRFAPGADYYIMMTVIDRLRVADQHMPCLKRRVTVTEGEVKGAAPVLDAPCSPSLPPTQQFSGEARPSASQVLGAAYGTKAAKYDDCAPNGDEFLRQARAAYVRAALDVPARKRPSFTERLMARFDRAFGAKG